MNHAPLRGRAPRIGGHKQRLHSGPGLNGAGIRTVKHPRNPARRGRALRRVLQNLEEPAPRGRFEPLDKVLFVRRKRGNNTLQVEKPHKLRPTLATAFREHELVT